MKQTSKEQNKQKKCSRRPCPAELLHCGRVEEKVAIVSQMTVVSENWLAEEIAED